MRVRALNGGPPSRPPPFFVILRGPLGVGKTSVSHALAQAIGGQVVSIDEFGEVDWDGGSLGLYLNGNRVAEERARPLLAKGVPVIFDGCFYWKGQIRDLERRLRHAHTVVTLNAPLAVCIERDSHRALVHGADAAREVYRKATRFRWGIPIDATQSIPAQLREIRRHLPRG